MGERKITRGRGTVSRCPPIRDLLLVSAWQHLHHRRPSPPEAFLKGWNASNTARKRSDRLVEIAGKLDAEATVVLGRGPRRRDQPSGGRVVQVGRTSTAYRGRPGRANWTTTSPKVATPGVDRLLAAAGAWSLAKQVAVTIVVTPGRSSRLILWMAKAPSTVASSPRDLDLDAGRAGGSVPMRPAQRRLFNRPSDDGLFASPTPNPRCVGASISPHAG